LEAEVERTPHHLREEMFEEVAETKELVVIEQE
jgi:hypothetical protein